MKRGHRYSFVLIALAGLIHSVAGRADTQTTGVGAAAVPNSSLPVIDTSRRFVPDYPPLLRQRGVSGFVLVQFRLEDHGRPRDPRVVLAEPQGAFEDVVLKSMRRLRFNAPPEWALSYPNRIMEMVYIFLIENCAHADAKAFPGMDALIVSTRMPPSPTNKVGCRPLESSSISHSID